MEALATARYNRRAGDGSRVYRSRDLQNYASFVVPWAFCPLAPSPPRHASPREPSRVIGCRPPKRDSTRVPKSLGNRFSSQPLKLDSGKAVSLLRANTIMLGIEWGPGEVGIQNYRRWVLFSFQDAG
jgi:hypothetical protein